jgi:hypothetical protein
MIRNAYLAAFLLVVLFASPAAAASDLARFWSGFKNFWNGVFGSVTGVIGIVIITGIIGVFIITRGKWLK